MSWLATGRYTRAAVKTSSNAIPHSSMGLVSRPMPRSEDRSLRAAIAVPAWAQATMATKVAVVAVR